MSRWKNGRTTPREELVNALTHGFGLVLSVGGIVVLVTLAAMRASAWHVVSVAIYGATLLVLYAASTLYHSSTTPARRHLFRRLDHAAIYLLIAGTYTPFTLVNLRGPWGWSLLGTVWGLALLGAAMELYLRRRIRVLAVGLYLALGWMITVAVRPLLASVEPGGLVLLLGGGLAYTLGTVFYIWRAFPYHHAVWHGFVLLGSLCHYFAVLFYVLPVMG